MRRAHASVTSYIFGAYQCTLFVTRRLTWGFRENWEYVA